MDRMTITKTKVSKFSIHTLFDAKAKSSFCWRYFGDLVVKADGKKKQVMTEQVFCNACLSNAQEEDGDISFGLAKVKSYAKTVSTGNLNRHLRDVHDVKEEEKAAEIIKEFFNAQQRSKTGNSTSSKGKKKDSLALAKDMAIWCCKSMIPFDSTSDEGTKDFFQKYKVIGTKEELPSKDAVCRVALDSVYESMLEDVKVQITTDVDSHAAVTFDLWTDQYRHLNYATFAVHYLTADFEHKAFTLCTNISEDEKTGETIKYMFNNAMQCFGLQDKNLHAVIDVRSEVRRAVALSGLDSHLCLGHALHNLITVDGIRSVPEIDAFVRKCKQIIRSINDRLPDLETDAEEVKVDLPYLLEQVSENLENDQREPMAYEDEEFESETQAIEKVFLRLGSINHVPSSRKDTPTRWLSVLAMLECLSHFCNRNSLNKMLSVVGKEELKIYQQEWNLLEDLLKFLRKFREVVEMITIQKTPSLNLAMVFHLEIRDILNSLSDDESSIMVSLKQKMLAKLDKRLPITNKIVAAAMLDPRFISLSQIDAYLAQKNTTRAAFLAGYIKAQPQVSTSRTSPVFVASGTNSDSLSTRLSKHSSSSLDFELDDAEQESRKYLATATAEEFDGDDILLYWKEKKGSFPMLSEVARALLAIPATSLPGKQIFTDAGLSLIAKRARLDPARVNKILFVHENYKC